jgi:hypothetical protein
MAVRSLGLKTSYSSKDKRSFGVMMLAKAPYNRELKM